MQLPIKTHVQIGDQVRRIDSAVWEVGEVVSLTEASAKVRWFSGRETSHAVGKLKVIDPTDLVQALAQ